MVRLVVPELQRRGVFRDRYTGATLRDNLGLGPARVRCPWLTRPGPLTGLRVVDAATLVAGPMVATMLGEFGAEVIKVEQPGAGDPLRTWGDRKDGIGLVWKSVSRNKRCVTLDLRQPRARSCSTGCSTSATCSWSATAPAPCSAGASTTSRSTPATRGW